MECCANALPKKDTAMHPHAFCFYPVKNFTILKKNLCAEASVLWYWRVVFTPFIPFTVRWFSLQQTWDMHMHALKAKLQPHWESTAWFHGLPNSLYEQQQLEISSTTDSLQQKGGIWGSSERCWHSKGVAALCLQSDGLNSETQVVVLTARETKQQHRD